MRCHLPQPLRVLSRNGCARVPAAHTTAELTSLLQSSADPKAAEFLAIRADKAQAKALKAQRPAVGVERHNGRGGGGRGRGRLAAR